MKVNEVLKFTFLTSSQSLFDFEHFEVAVSHLEDGRFIAPS